MGKTLVAIAAHADDVELNAGGTVAKWAAGGGDVHVIMMTDNCSGLRLDPDKTTAIRHKEQEAAANLYGGKVHYMGYSQRHYWDEATARQINIAYEHDLPAAPSVKGCLPLVIAADEPREIDALAELLLGLKPDLVLTQSPVDLDPEHQAVVSMVWRVFQKCSARLANVPLRFWMPGSSAQDGVMDPHYDHFEDITDFFDKKLQLCACHASQMNEPRWDMVKERATFFGKQAAVQYCEAFTTATRERRFGWFTGSDWERHGTIRPPEADRGQGG